MALMGDGIGHLAFAGVAAGVLLNVLAGVDRARHRRGRCARRRVARGREPAGDLALGDVLLRAASRLGVALVAGGGLDANLFSYLSARSSPSTAARLVVVACSAS